MEKCGKCNLAMGEFTRCGNCGWVMPTEANIRTEFQKLVRVMGVFAGLCPDYYRDYPGNKPSDSTLQLYGDGRWRVDVRGPLGGMQCTSANSTAALGAIQETAQDIIRRVKEHRDRAKEEVRKDCDALLEINRIMEGRE